MTGRLLAQARFVDEEPGNAFWQLLHQLADAATPQLFHDVNQILASVGTGINREQLTSWLSTNNQVAAIDALHNTWEQLGDFGLRDQVLPQLQALALSAAQETVLVDVSVRFNVQDQEALASIEQQTGAAMTAISQASREAIQGVVKRTFESGLPLTQQVSEIESLIGLTPLQTERLARFRQGLVEEGMAQTQVERAVERMARQVRRQRAETIARTESMSAAMLGQDERWQQAVRAGLLDQDRLRRRWIVTPDDRLCKTVCLPIPGLNPDGRLLGEAFSTPVGPVMRPPAHPACRCALSGQIT